MRGVVSHLSFLPPASVRVRRSRFKMASNDHTEAGKLTMPITRVVGRLMSCAGRFGRPWHGRPRDPSMAVMTGPETRPDCGARLPAGLPAGPCPLCLLRPAADPAVGSDRGASTDDHGPADGEAGAFPTPAALSAEDTAIGPSVAPVSGTFAGDTRSLAADRSGAGEGRRPTLPGHGASQDS